MITFDNQGMRLLIQTMGKTFEVTDICDTQEEANAAMEANPETSLIGTDNHGRHYLALSKSQPSRGGSMPRPTPVESFVKTLTQH